MSAFLCSSQHISRIVNTAKPRDLMRSPTDGMSDAEYTFTVLVAENRASLMARYGTDDSDVDLSYLPREKPGCPIAVIKLINSYGYQSCEHDGWERSEAKAWIDELMCSLVMDLPGYEQAAWSV